jgi:ERCC4-type nuclease
LTIRRALSAGDYAVFDGRGDIYAAVERKTAEDFASSITDASLSFEMLELSALPHAGVVIEWSYSRVLRNPYTQTGICPNS